MLAIGGEIRSNLGELWGQSKLSFNKISGDLLSFGLMFFWSIRDRSRISKHPDISYRGAGAGRMWNDMRTLLKTLSKSRTSKRGWGQARDTRTIRVHNSKARLVRMMHHEYSWCVMSTHGELCEINKSYKTSEQMTTNGYLYLLHTTHYL